MSISDHAPKAKPITKWVAARAPIELRNNVEKILDKKGITWQDFIVMALTEYLIENEKKKLS